MEAAMAGMIEQASELSVSPEPAAETAIPERMFKHSEYVDFGAGAVECKEKDTCTNIEHFHAWCRLPNPFQQQDLREKGLAAKARRLRSLADPESDAAVILDAEMASYADSMYTDILVDDLLQRDWAQDYLAAQEEVDNLDEYEHIEQDREEYTRLSAAEAHLPEDEQSNEFKELQKHIAKYLDDVKVRLDAIHEPRRAELASRGHEALLVLARAKRVEEEGTKAHIDTYNAWTWYVGTYSRELHPTLGRPYKLKWASIGRKDFPEPGSMYAESPEVLELIRDVFNGLSSALQQGSSGN